MKVLMVLSNPLQVDPRVQNEAIALHKKNHQISVVCWDRQKEHPMRQWYEKRISIFNVHNTDGMRILPNDLARNYFWWKKAFEKAEYVKRYEGDFDIVHCHDLDTLQVGVWLKEKYGCGLVYDCHENFPGMIHGNVPWLAYKYAQHMERSLIKKVDQIITVSTPLRDYLKSFSDKPIMIVRNCKNLVYKKYVEPENKKFVLCYIGVMMKERLFPEIVSMIGDIPDVSLMLGGKKEALYDQTKKISEEYDNVEFIGTVKTKDIFYVTHSSNLVFLFEPPNKYGTLFNKQFEAMVAGRPIMMTKNTYAGEMTERLGVGYTTDYDLDSIEKGICHLRDNPDECVEMGKNAFELAMTKLNWKKEQERLLEVYEKLC